MAYADQSMSGNKLTALIIVALIHVAVGYALVTGLAYEAAKKVIQKVTTVDIKEEVKKEEPHRRRPRRRILRRRRSSRRRPRSTLPPRHR